MKKLLTVTAALLLFVGLLVSVPVTSQATIGVEVAGSTDANGLYYEAKWLDGNWSEFYSIGSSYWGTWIEEGTAETPGTETGDFYSYANMDSGDGFISYQWESDLDGVTKSENWAKNTTTGYYMYDLEYDALALSDPTVAYYESISQEDDPLSGYSDYYYYREVDFDGDNNGSDDWSYSEWKYEDPGTGDTREGHSLYNYVDGIREYDDYDLNTLTGDYDIDRDYYKDSDMDGSWTDNYYTQYDEWYDAYDGEYYKRDRMWDYSSVMHDVATYYSYTYDEYKLTGSWEETTDARFDTDGDGSWNDYGYLGASPGAYRIYKNASYDVGEKYSYSEDSLWDAINNVYDRKYTETYEDTGYSETWFYYRWDQDKDGSYSDDYYYYGDSYTNYYGENYQYFYSFDHLNAQPTYYEFERDENPVNGYLYTYTYYQYDTDGDGSWSDYSSGGAYYSYDYEYNDPIGSYEREITTYTPPSDDHSVLFTYDYYYKETMGLYAYEETEKVIDADFDNYLWDYSGGNFGGAYYYDTWTEHDPDYYDDYYAETTIYDPWANYYQHSYSNWEPGVNGEVFYSDSYTDLYLDTDDDNDYTENYYAYAEVYSDQYDGDGYNYTENYYYDYDNGVYNYDYAESYASGHYWTEHEYAKDTDGDGSIEQGGSYYGYDDFWNLVITEYDANTGETSFTSWTSDDQDNDRGAYWYTATYNSSYDTTDSWSKDAESANLAGYVATSSGYSASDGYSWSTQEAKTWGVDYVSSGSWSYDGGNSGTWTNKQWDTDANTAWNNTWDYEIYSSTWDETSNGSHLVGYSLNDYDTGNYFYSEKISNASYFVTVWDNDVQTAGYENWGTLASVSEGVAPFAGESEWTYDVASPNDYEKYIYSGDTGEWYLMYYY